ncbi:MAG: acyl-CoA desaturase [Bacteriovoracaceae bacterium]|jgi:stearoyl-CoA desaturase (Delta-9 desaturase)|nr:acyl-CoA desaturase [Bacteriovoracaceae bacterium]
MKNQLKKIDWINTLFITTTPILAGLACYYHFSIEGASIAPWVIFTIFYFLTGFSITAGYHRLFSHRAYKARAPIRLFFLIFGAGAFQNSALKWSTDHRRHHNKVDTDEDPYNAKRGFWYSHVGWIFFKEEDKYRGKFSSDLANDPLVMWQHKYYLPLAVFTGIILPALLGALFSSPIGGLAIAGLARVVFVHHCTFFINSLCHIVGKRTYNNDNTARDSAILAFFTYGEGYHNFHHKFQTDYRNGIRWYQFDPTKWVIYTMKKIGLAANLKKTSPQEILKARLLADEVRTTLISPNFAESMEELRVKVEQASKKFQMIRIEYKKLKREFKREFEGQREETLKELKLKMKLAKLDFKTSYARWRLLVNHPHIAVPGF